MTLRKDTFDFSKYLKVPDEWIENALAVPETVQQKPKAVPFPRRYITAAGIVLVAVLGVTVYFLFGNKNVIPVKPVSTGPAIQTATQIATENGTTAEMPTAICTHAATENNRHKPSEKPTQPATQIATDSMGRITVIPMTEPTNAGTDAAVLPTQPLATTPPTEYREPDHPAQTATERPHRQPTREPTEKPLTQPTRKPAVKPTTPAKPTEAQRPTQHLSVKPTTSPKPTEAQRPTQKPTSAPVTEKPTHPSAPDVKTVEVILPIREAVTAAESDDDTLYCCVYDSKGRLLGDSDLYSRSHWVSIRDAAEVVGYQSDVPCYYYAVDYDANQMSDVHFSYKIYLRDGTVIEEGTV